MALTRKAFELIAPLIADARILCFGYPDLLLSPEEASSLVGSPVRATDHGKTHKHREPCADTLQAFARARESLFIDIKRSRGVEHILDLNFPLPETWRGDYDLVIDAGTIEHCANIGQALMNAAQAVAPGGHVYHGPPLSMLNHGFYNICPTLLFDFYSTNGWEVKHFSAFEVISPAFPEVAVPATQRAKIPPNVAAHFLAQRGERASSDLRWPSVQSRYAG